MEGSMRRRTGIALLAAVAVIAVGVGVWAVNGPLRQPTFTCSTPDTRACMNTERTVLGLDGMTWVFGDPLPARLLSVDVRPTPPEWHSQEGDWAVLLTFEGRDPALALCYYSSDDMVACDIRGDGSAGS
jgi:hypothetical protein